MDNAIQSVGIIALISAYIIASPLHQIVTALREANKLKRDSLKEPLPKTAALATPKTYDVQIINTPAGMLGVTHLTPRATV